MSTEILKTPEIALNRYWGGNKNGVMLQVTPTNGRYASLDLKAALEVQRTLADFINYAMDAEARRNTLTPQNKRIKNVLAMAFQEVEDIKNGKGLDF